MNGPDFKQTRKILLENLSGHAAFRTDEEAQKFLAREKAKRDALKAAKQVHRRAVPPLGKRLHQQMPSRHSSAVGQTRRRCWRRERKLSSPSGGRKICETLFHCTDISSENVHYQADKLQKCTRSFLSIFVEYMFFYILAIIRT